MTAPQRRLPPPQLPRTIWGLWNHDDAGWLRGKDSMSYPFYCYTNQIDAAQACAALSEDYNLEPRPFLIGRTPTGPDDHA